VVHRVVGPSRRVFLYALWIFHISIRDEMGHISGISGHPASTLDTVCTYAEADHLLEALDLLSTCGLTLHIRL